MGNEKWVLVPNDFMKLKKILFDWQTGMAKNNAWNAVFWTNHDQPRPVSRYGDEEKYWKESAKMLVICNFYGEEITWTADRDLNGYHVLAANYADQSIQDNLVSLRPYETMVLYKAE